MSGSSNNSWTILTPENQASAAAETLRPLTEETQRQDEPSALTEGDGAHVLPEEDHLTSEESITKPCEEADPSTRLLSSAPSEPLHGPVLDAPTEEKPVDLGLSHAEQESFSDSYSHLGPSTEDGPAPPLTTETLGHLDSGQGEEERGPTGAQDETPPQRPSEELQEAESKEETREETKEETETPPWSPLETPQDPSVQPESLTAQEPELRKRRSLLEKIGRQDEEEEAEEDFQLPQREDDSGITLNKCILGAVILLGLGTIFISGVFLDLDDEGEYPSVDLKDSETSGKQEWLNPDVARAAAEVDSTELLNKLNKGNDQVVMSQAQPQSQNEKLKEAQAAGGSTEHLQQQQQEEEEVEKLNSRLKRDMESVPVLQKELEKMRTELESVSVLKKEVETLRSTLTQLKLSAAAAQSPPGGRTEDNIQRHVHSKDKHDRGVREEWKEKSGWKKEKKQRKDGGKMEGKDQERKRDKFEGEKYDKKHKDDKYSKHGEDAREWKSKRGDEGKMWKEKNEKREWHDKKEKKEWKEKSEKKEWNDRSDKKSKDEKFKDDREWRNREERKDFKDEKRHGEKHKGPGEKEWKKGRDESKEKNERKHWKEREGYESRNGGKKERSENGQKWKKRDDGKEKEEWKNGRDESKERYERKHWKEREGYESRNGEKKERSENGKRWKTTQEGKDEEWREGKEEKHHGERGWTERKPAQKPKPSVGQPEYWTRQRARLQHSSRPPQPCHSPDTCARAEGVRPVSYTEFEAVLQGYLSKARTAGVDAAHVDELQKLAAELFQNGAFPHDQMSFQDYVEDVGDILEDLVEGDDEGDQKGSEVEDEMEGFEREVMLKFTLPDSGEQGSRVKGEWREESGRGRA